MFDALYTNGLFSVKIQRFIDAIALPQRNSKYFCFFLVFKTDDKVIRITDQLCKTVKLWDYLSLKPRVQHIVKVYIGKNWAQYSTLWRTLIRLKIYPFFHYPRL